MSETHETLFHHVRFALAVPFYLAAIPLVWIADKLDPGSYRL